MSEHARPDRDRVKHWNEILKPYRGAETHRSVTQLLTSAIPYFALWYLAYLSLQV